MTGNISAYTKFWTRENFSTASSAEIAKVVMLPSTTPKYFDFNGAWFWQYGTREMGFVHNFYKGTIFDDGKIEMLEKVTLKELVIGEDNNEIWRKREKIVRFIISVL